MKVNANSLRVGNVIEHKGRLWRITRTMHTQPGKGGAYVQAELKDVVSGTKLNERFRSSEDVEKIRLDQRDFQFLYGSDNDFTFMDQESYEQVVIPRSLLDDEQISFLKDNMEVKIDFHDDKPLGVELPEKVTLTIVETEAVIKGQTAASSYKPAIMDNGLRVMVPPHIESGVRIVVSTLDSSYVERAKD